MFTAINVGLIMVLATLVALLIGALGKWMRFAVMGGLVVAWAIPVIAATTVFQWLFQSQLGVVNWVLVALGFEQFDGNAWFARRQLDLRDHRHPDRLAVGAVRGADPLRGDDHGARRNCTSRPRSTAPAR